MISLSISERLYQDFPSPDEAREAFPAAAAAGGAKPRGWRRVGISSPGIAGQGSRGGALPPAPTLSPRTAFALSTAHRAAACAAITAASACAQLWSLEAGAAAMAALFGSGGMEGHGSSGTP